VAGAAWADHLEVIALAASHATPASMMEFKKFKRYSLLAIRTAVTLL
jgi:hypothetical protein